MVSCSYIRSAIFFVIVTLLFVTTSSAQANTPISNTRIITDHNRTLVPLTIDDVKLVFLLDTGASTSLIFKNEQTDKLTNINHKTDVLVKFPAFRTTSTATRISELSFTTDDNFSFILHDILFLEDPALLGQASESFDGIIGREFFRKFVIEVDPLSKQLTLHDTNVNLAKDYPLAHRLTSPEKSPHIILASKFPWEKFPTRKRLLLDTGYPGGMVIWSKKHFRNVTTKTERDKLGDDNSGVFIRLDIQFNRLLFRQIPIFFSNSPSPTQSKTDGLLGAGLLIQYKHVYDFNRKKLLLKPLIAENGKPPAMSLAGIYTPNNENFITKNYRPDVPAQPRIIINADSTFAYQ
nr:retropepsin-like aspartic protease [Kordiimonas laminariae]